MKKNLTSKYGPKFLRLSTFLAKERINWYKFCTTSRNPSFYCETHLKHIQNTTRNPEKSIFTPGKNPLRYQIHRTPLALCFCVSQMQVVHATTAVNVFLGAFLFLPPNVRVSPGWAKKDDMDDIPFKRHRMSHDGSKNTPVLVAN